MSSSDSIRRVPTALPPARGSTVLRNVSHGANDLYWFILPMVLPLILQEFGLSYTAAGGMIAAFLAVGALSSMLMGRLSDRLHRTRLIGFGFLLASAALWVGSLMPILPLVISLFLIGGIGVGTYHPAAYASIHDSGQGRGGTYGAFEASGSLALVLMLAAQGLLVSRIGWRGVIVVGIIPGALIGLVLLLFSGVSLGGRSGDAAVGNGELPGTPGLTRGIGLSALFVAGVMLRMLGTNALQSFVPTYLVDSVGMEPSLASFAMGFTFLGSLAGSIVMGRMADRRGHFATLFLSMGLLVPLLPVLGLRLPPAVYPALLVGFGFLSAACFPAQTLILADLTGTRGKGFVFGVLTGMSALTGAVSPLLFGLLADAAGLVTAVRACVIPVALSGIVTLVVWRSLRTRA
jgi:FSR family fosmidomycin resistance protein-like MFS transporter